LVKTAPEIFTKSESVKRRFVSILVNNLRTALRNAGVEAKVESGRDRVRVYASDLDAAAQGARRVFGVHSVCPALESDAVSLEAVVAECVAVAKGVLKNGDSFAVRCARSGKQSFSSKDVEVAAGNAIRAAVKGVAVNLSNPAHFIFVEARPAHCAVFADAFEGLKGLPVGSQGLVGLFLDEKTDWEKAGFLLLKRGCKIIGVCDTTPSQEKLAALSRFNSGNPIKVVRSDELPRVRDVLALASAKTDLAAPSLFNGLPLLYPLQGFPKQLFPQEVFV
jgi:thiamine biosynthesis protein ThiI